MRVKDLIAPKGALFWIFVIALLLTRFQLFIGDAIRDNTVVRRDVPCSVKKASGSVTATLTLDCGGAEVTTKDTYAVVAHIQNPRAFIVCNVQRDNTANCDDPKKK